MGFFDFLKSAAQREAAEIAYDATVSEAELALRRKADEEVDRLTEPTKEKIAKKVVGWDKQQAARDAQNKELQENITAEVMQNLDPTHLEDFSKQTMAYNDEQQRLRQIGVRGSASIQSVTPIPGAVQVDPNLGWMEVRATITLPGGSPYTATTTHLMHSSTAMVYAPGTTHSVLVDPGDGNRFAFG